MPFCLWRFFKECVVQFVFPPSFFLQSNIKVGHYKSSRLQGCSSALIGDPEDDAVLPAAPDSRNSSPRVSTAACAKIHTELNPSVTSGSTASLSLESDVNFSSDEDEDTCSCASAASNSLPSPEIFRKETSGVWNVCVSSTTVPAYFVIFISLIEEALILPFKEELPAIYLDNKNSTLLDASHAVSIHMHPAPNLSTIFGNLTKSSS